MRHSMNLRMNARGRPHTGQRLRSRTETGCVPLSFVNFRLRGIFWERRAMLAPERHAEVAQQRASLFVGLRRCHDRDVETLDLVDPVVVDFREDDLLAQT